MCFDRGSIVPPCFQTPWTHTCMLRSHPTNAHHTNPNPKLWDHFLPKSTTSTYGAPQRIFEAPISVEFLSRGLAKQLGRNPKCELLSPQLGFQGFLGLSCSNSSCLTFATHYYCISSTLYPLRNVMSEQDFSDFDSQIPEKSLFSING